MRVKTFEVQGQEILTRDEVALRINLTATYQYEDAAPALRKLKNPLDHLYKEIQFGLRAAVGTRSLDALLEDKTSIDEQVAKSPGSRFSDVGISQLVICHCVATINHGLKVRKNFATTKIRHRL